MSGEQDKLVLHDLRRMAARMDRMNDTLDEFLLSPSVEERMLALRSGRPAETSVPMDKPERRVERIERRLDLVENRP